MGGNQCMSWQLRVLEAFFERSGLDSHWQLALTAPWQWKLWQKQR
jgi:hypothetical protein